MKDFYELIEKVKDKFNLSNDQLTKLYIEYLCLEDKKSGKRKGYISKEDKTPIGNTAMGIYLHTEQTTIKRLLEKETLTPSEQNKIDNYNKIIKIKESFTIEEQNEITKIYIDYLNLEDKESRKRKGYISTEDKTPIGNTTMGIYLNTEQTAIKRLLEKETLTPSEQNKITLCLCSP